MSDSLLIQELTEVRQLLQKQDQNLTTLRAAVEKLRLELGETRLILETTEIHAGKFKARAERLAALLSRCCRDIFQTARVNQGYLTGIDIAIPEDPPCREWIGHHHVHQAGVDESLRLIKEAKEAFTQKEE